MTSFTDLQLDPALLKALAAEGYTTPTPIQAQAIPTVMAGRDLMGIAQTGTGKTAAFALPILHRLAAERRLAARHGARVLVLSPTRELASQIAESFRTYGRHLGFTVTTVFGGVAHRPQAQALARGVDVLVATPGRLLDHMGERNISLSTTEILVLDEADQMMDLGFIKPLRQIIGKLPARRQSLFFSATMPREIEELAKELLRDPAKVAVTPIAKTADRVTQKVVFVEAPKKRSLLVELFSDPAMRRALVFTRTKRGADRVAQHLEKAGIATAAIHGNKSQGQRDRALAEFKASKIRALIATDIAARGIDIDEVTHVINYELPNIPESYVHRIGRTARAGAEGIAISLVDGEERAYLTDIERLTRQRIPSVDRRGDATLVVTRNEPSSAEREERGVRGHRPSGRGHHGASGRNNGGHARGGNGHRHGDQRQGDSRGDHRGDQRGNSSHQQRDGVRAERSNVQDHGPRAGDNRDGHSSESRSHSNGHSNGHSHGHSAQAREAHRNGRQAHKGHRGRPGGPNRQRDNSRGETRGPMQAGGYRGEPR